MRFFLRLGLAVSLAVSAVSHAYLYIHGYQHIPMIGTAFLIQASRTVGLLGFTERGWDPSPHAALSVASEALCVLLWAGAFVRLPRPRAIAVHRP
jgi:hypothetical protein